MFLHGLIRDTQGVKMSKTKGNVLDPIQVIEQFGTDALRFALTTGTAPGNDLRLGESKLESSRNFANKLWNAARFVMASLKSADAASLSGWYDLPELKHRQDRWLLDRLNLAIGSVNHYLREYEIGEAQRTIYEFLWGEFCDWYIEMAKVRLRAGDSEPLRVLAHVLERTLRLLHPFMPFITEEIWQNLLGLLPKEGDPSALSLPESINGGAIPGGGCGPRRPPGRAGNAKLDSLDTGHQERPGPSSVFLPVRISRRWSTLTD